MGSAWVVYILKCADNTLYTGVTTDLAARIAKHESGKGAKYTRNRGPFSVIFTEQHPDRSQASRRETYIKTLSRAEKLALISTGAERSELPE